MAHDPLANCTCYVLTLSPIDQFTLRFGAHNEACPVWRESGDYLDQKRDIEARARLESLPTTDLERAYWAEVRENRQEPTPAHGVQTDELATLRAEVAQWRAQYGDQEPDPAPPTYTPTDDDDKADQARLAALDTYPAVAQCLECGRLFEPDRKDDDICADC